MFLWCIALCHRSIFRVQTHPTGVYLMLDPLVDACQLLEVSLLGVGTVLRLDKHVSSNAKRLRQSTNKYTSACVWRRSGRA